MSIWDALEKAAYTGLGLAALTKDKLEEAVETLKKERGLTEEEGRKLSEELKHEAENARNKLDEHIDVAVDKALSRLKLAKASDVENLKRRIGELEEALKKTDKGSQE